MAEADILNSSNITDEELMEQLDGSQDFPRAQSKDTIFKFFREVLKLEDSSKVANYREEELGKMRLSVRSNLEIAAYSEAESLLPVAQYFKTKAEIISKTSMGRKGFLAQLFVTQIKKEQKMTPPQERKPKFWGGSQPQPQGDTQ